MSDFGYPITLRLLAAVAGGCWLAEVPELPGCMSDGRPVPAQTRQVVKEHELG